MEASRPSQSKRRVQAIKSVNAVLFRGNSSVLGFVYVFREARFDVLGQLAALRRYAWSLTRRHVDAEDLVTRRTRAAYEKRATFHGGNLEVWLLSILHNVNVDGS